MTMSLINIYIYKCSTRQWINTLWEWRRASAQANHKITFKKETHLKYIKGEDKTNILFSGIWSVVFCWFSFDPQPKLIWYIYLYIQMYITLNSKWTYIYAIKQFWSIRWSFEREKKLTTTTWRRAEYFYVS